MLGSWQQKIIECLELGPISIEALMLRLGAHSRERRDKVHLSLRRLQDQGTIRVTGQRGRSTIGAMVERVDPVVRSPMPR